MTTETFNKILNNPSSITDSELKQLEVLIWNAPYCQLANILIAKGYFDRNDILKDRKLKTAATISTSRKKLKEVIFSKPLIIETNKVEKKEIKKAESTSLVDDKKEKTASEEKKVVDEINQNLKLLKSLRNSAVSTNESKKQPEQTVKRKILTKKKVEKKTTKSQEVPDKEKVKSPIKKSSSIKKKVNNNPIKETLNDKIEIHSSRLGSIEQDELLSNFVKTDGEFLLDYLELLRDKKQPIKKKKQEDIIDNFIKTDPSIGQLKKQEKSIEEEVNDLSKRSYKENLKLVSENLAKINIKQGNISKAISIYESLILKNPQKKTYFAEQIEKLKKQ